ncbi:MAG: hypothetical protein ACSHWY_10715 [Octadecabacter sp.]
MIRAAFALGLMATAATAQTVSYEDAVSLLEPAFIAKVDAYYAAVGDGSYFEQMLETDNTLVFRQPDGALRLFKPELIATFDETTGLCAYAFDVDDYPNLPRIAAASVVVAARNNDWPADTTAPIQSDMSQCYLRAAMASITSELVMVYPLDTGDTVYYLGLPDYGTMR